MVELAGGVQLSGRPGPSLTDQMVVVCDEQALGLVPPSTLDEVRERLRGLPYVPAAVITARIAALLWPIPMTPSSNSGSPRASSARTPE